MLNPPLCSALTKILDKITILQRESCAKKLWRQLKTHGQTVQELQREFDDAIRQCSVRGPRVIRSVDELNGYPVSDIAVDGQRNFEESPAGRLDEDYRGTLTEI